MKVLIINHREVSQLLPMNECIEVMANALKALSQGDAANPLRTVMWLPEKAGALGMMPAYWSDQKVMGLKALSVFSSNMDTEYDSHQGGVFLFETKNGRPLAIVDASAITAIRTGAVSGVATRLLARQDAGDLAMLGSGVQAWGHLEAMLKVRKIRRVRVWSLPLDHARKFVERVSRHYNIHAEFIASAREAVTGADLICTVTSAGEPILAGEWIASGTHINAVGSSVPFTRELDTAAVVKSRLFVDRRESTINEAGDFLFPKREGAIDDSHIQGEIGEILASRIEGRRSQDEITLFKALGLAVEDVAAAHYVYTKAIEKGLGTYVELGDTRHTS